MAETLAPDEADRETTSSAPVLPSRRSKWAWRLGSLLVVALAIGLLWLGNQRAEVTQPTSTGDLVVTKLTPGDGAKALRQTQVGANLLDEFDGRLVINGIPIPEEQMEGVVSPDSPERRGLDPETASQLRPNNRNRVFFLPGPGKVIEKLPQGDNEITVTYFQDGAPTLRRGSLTWTINVD